MSFAALPVIGVLRGGILGRDRNRDTAVGPIDPTRETLDLLAELTEAGQLCVHAEFSGVPSC